MVKLTKIYTKSGDDGSTGLGTGDRVSKASPRVAAYGEVDELNAAIGVAITHASDAPGGIAITLEAIQHDLFDVGADLCVPTPEDEEKGARLRITPAHTARLEEEIDRINERLAPLTSFVLPGGSPLAAALHLARTVARRAERAVIVLGETEGERINAEPLRYLNRLSDLLFVMARAANDWGAKDTLWAPGKNLGNEGGS